MSAPSLIRTVTVEVLRLNARPSTSRTHTSVLCSAARHACPSSRAFHVYSISRAWAKNSQISKKPKETEAQRKSKERKLKEIGLRGRDIPYREVQVSSREGLSAFRPLEDVLAEVEHLNALDPGSRLRYHAQLIVNNPTPIVKIVDFKEEFKRQKEARDRAKNTAPQKVRKEVQLTWSSSEADVETKLQKVKEDLEKGYRVDLAVIPKQGTRAPRVQDIKARVEELADRFTEIAKEWKARDTTRAASVIYLQGIATPSTGIKEQGVGGVPKKVLLKEQRRQKEAERLKRKGEQEAEFEKKHSITDGVELIP